MYTSGPTAGVSQVSYQFSPTVNDVGIHTYTVIVTSYSGSTATSSDSSYTFQMQYLSPSS